MEGSFLVHADFYYREFNEMEKKRQRKVDTGEIDDEFDEELDRGLVVPGRIWSKLFK
jgi:hypothetical protein